MTGISGCFGSTKPEGPIDDLDEARSAVNDIIENAPEAAQEEPSQGAAPDLAALQVVGQYVRRVRLLTWAVVAIAVYLVLKEAK